MRKSSVLLQLYEKVRAEFATDRDLRYEEWRNERIKLVIDSGLAARTLSSRIQNNTATVCNRAVTPNGKYNGLS